MSKEGSSGRLHLHDLVADSPTALVIVLLLVSLLICLIWPAVADARSSKFPHDVAALDSLLGARESADIRGKVVYVDFWASWCAPCGQSLPWMRGLQTRYADKGLTVIAINVDKKPDDARTFLDDRRLSLDIVFDSTGSLAKRFDLKTMPTSFFYDRSGNLRLRHEGFVTSDTLSLDSLVAALIEEKPK